MLDWLACFMFHALTFFFAGALARLTRPLGFDFARSAAARAAARFCAAARRGSLALAAAAAACQQNIDVQVRESIETNSKRQCPVSQAYTTTNHRQTSRSSFRFAFASSTDIVGGSSFSVLVGAVGWSLASNADAEVAAARSNP